MKICLSSYYNEESVWLTLGVWMHHLSSLLVTPDTASNECMKISHIQNTMRSSAKTLQGNHTFKHNVIAYKNTHTNMNTTLHKNAKKKKKCFKFYNFGWQSVSDIKEPPWHIIWELLWNYKTWIQVKHFILTKHRI